MIANKNTLFGSDFGRIMFIQSRDGKDVADSQTTALKNIYRKAAYALKLRGEYTFMSDEGRLVIVRPQRNNPYRKIYIQAAANHRQLERIRGVKPT